MTVLERVAALVASVNPDPAERDLLRLHVVDTIGAWHAGQRTPEGVALRGLETAPVPAMTSGVLDRIAVACATVRLTEIDDIHLPSCTTPSSVMVPVALGLAAALPQPGDIQAAMAAGYRAMLRLGEAIDGANILYRGIWPTYFTAPFAAATIAARLLGLDKDKTAHALAIALTMSTGGSGRTAPVAPRSGATASRWLLLGNAVRAGCLAALAAERGMTADLTLLDGDWLQATHGIKFDREKLGRIAEPAVGEISYKPWCSAKQAIAATDAFQRILARGIRPDDISEIIVDVPPPYFPMVSHRAPPEAGLGALTSVACRIGLAAYDPKRLDDVARSATPGARGVTALIGKVTVQADEKLMQHYPARYPARVTVATQAGRNSELVVDAPGDPGTDYGEASVVAKFRRFAGNQPMPSLAALDETAQLKALGRQMCGLS
jgi:2-methylcitrate dehydratase PrpD